MYDYVTADNAEVPHVEVIREHANGIDVTTVAEFFITDDHPVELCEFLAELTISALSGCADDERRRGFVLLPDGVLR